MNSTREQSNRPNAGRRSAKGVAMGSLGSVVGSRLGQKITAMRVDEAANALLIETAPGGRFRLFDVLDVCCEHRYMLSDDDPAAFIGAELVEIEVADGPEEEDEHGTLKECQFLRVKTSQGDFVIVNYNEHNGYYGGIRLVARDGWPAGGEGGGDE